MVSVIIIFLNAERFIQEAIESVFAQTYDEWELLLVNDGSTDGSTAIALQYAAQSPGKVRYLEHEGHQNRGMSASRNLGIRHATGEYIAFLDADDVWMPQKLERQVAILDTQPEAGMVYGATQWWYSWTGNPEDMHRDYVPALGIQPNTLVKPPTLLILFLTSKAPTPCPSDLLLRHEIVEHVGGFEESFTGMLQLFEDQAFLAKVYLKTSVFVANGCWDKYRQHPDSCVSIVTKAGQQYSVGLFYLHWLTEYLSEHEIKNSEIWRALRKMRWRYRHPRLHHLPQDIRHLVNQMRGLLRRFVSSAMKC